MKKPTKRTPKRTSYEDVCKRLGVKPLPKSKRVCKILPPKPANPDFTKTHTKGRYGSKRGRHYEDAMMLNESARGALKGIGAFLSA